ncbi:phosphomannomutase [Aureimonas sp. OT7]|uniref:phosphomannomutase n=1 Tax=Aureimonas sp. OT7 TaxID=2816454 RepID=UPI00177CDB5A|nr:phosphomannomutase [Aureimonas sp. OT7]QOG05747.1 phosphomannomutase [Aureimonas sp. OT7]
MAASDLKFGTSGLRGLVVDIQGVAARRWTSAFLSIVDTRPAGEVLIGRDLRDSSPAIAGDCAVGACAAGWRPLDAGTLPTPALAMAAMARGCPAIMVTGSHIPEDRNGLKFYLPSGEITKAHEAAIRSAYTDAGPFVEPAKCEFATVDVVQAYLDRYRAFFGTGALAGLRVGIYQQSAVGRDTLVELIGALGAKVVSLGRSEHFIPIDTEAHHPRDIMLVQGWAQEGRFDAIVSTDGDGDRPLVADGHGNFVRGDLLGLMTAMHLDIDAIVTPVTSSTAVERSGVAQRVLRTRVGSPYVIEGMEQLRADNLPHVLGFEANGGVLLGSDLTRAGQTLPALPTRDAVLPIIAALAEARAKGGSLRHAVDALSPGHALADRLENVAPEKSAAFLTRLGADEAFAAALFAEQGGTIGIDAIDGVRFVLADGSVVHFRASGNAPELRCYVEATDAARASALLAWGISAAQRQVS